MPNPWSEEEEEEEEEEVRSTGSSLRKVDDTCYETLQRALLGV
jgi:hypothetical protein